MLRIDTVWKKLAVSFVLSFGIFVAIGVTQPAKTSALGCYPSPNAAYFNAMVMVKVLNPDGSFNKWSQNFNFNVVAADPHPYGNKWHVPTNGIAWTGRAGFPTSNANFTATAGGGSTEQCTALDGRTATTFMFGDGTDGKAFLACNWGTWGGGAGKEHGLAFYFSPTSVNDAGGAGYWVPGANGYVEPGGLRDANNQQAIITFQFQLTESTGQNEAPSGRLDELNCGAFEINGWAFDPNSRGSLIRVDFYNGRLGVGYGLGSIMTDRQPSPGEPLPANSRFGYDIRRNPELFSGQHDIYAYAIDAQDPGVHTELTWSVNGQNHYRLDYRSRCGDIPSSEGYVTPIATARFKDDAESPTSLVLTTSTSAYGPSYDYTTTREYFTIKDGVIAPINPGILGLGANPIGSTSSGDFGPEVVTILDPITRLGLKVGDQVCAKTSVSPQHFKVDVIGNKTPLPPTAPGADVSIPGCDTVQNKPYVSFYGNDVRAGGDVVGTANCETKQAAIRTFTNISDQGSSTQFAAFALGSIAGITTAKQRASYPLPPNDLKAPSFGAYNGGCTHNYYADRESGASAWPGTTTGANGKYNVTGDLNLGTTLVGPGQHIYLYVSGNVTITGNITLDTGPWADKSQIPSFYVIANGDINIDRNVNHIAGIFVAQNSSPSTAIYTCTNGSAKIGVKGLTVNDGMYNLCGKQLIIDGSFIAKKVVLGRAFGTLRNSATDNPYGGVGAKNCASKEAFQPATNTCAAEVFLYNPSLYLAESPAASGTASESTKEFEFVTNLPPVL